MLAIVGATLGKTAIVYDMPDFHIQRSLAVFRPNNAVLCFNYLYFLFQSEGFQQLLWSNVGFSAQPGIYLGTLSNFRIPIPSLLEQERITSWITEKVNKIDILMGKAIRAIELLNERRTALISAAVTGKIDVRNA